MQPNNKSLIVIYVDCMTVSHTPNFLFVGKVKPDIFSAKKEVL